MWPLLAASSIRKLLALTMPYPSLQVEDDPFSEDSDPFAVTPPSYHKQTRPNTTQILSDTFQRALSATTRFVPEEYEYESERELQEGESEYHWSADVEDDQTFVNGTEEVRLLEKAEGRNVDTWNGSRAAGGNGRRGSLGMRSQWRELVVCKSEKLSKFTIYIQQTICRMVPARIIVSGKYYMEEPQSLLS